MTNLTKKDLIENLYYDLGLSKQHTENLVNAFFESMQQELSENVDTIKLTNFGRFKKASKSARVGRNPKTNQEYEICARNVVTFKNSNVLKNKLI